ncbi:hypothetical protein HW555_010258 [Spodoptera exigua]|uniref:40S ribosomal protein S7 n=1 Tax=Spodoptera exigua TaxID=7107 RepID=A0A835L2R3_SPOEX|nr:hypothetical protein HW555_010258 [Spodoptera exigua]
MSTKIIKASAAEPDVFETSISQALVELETNSDLKAQLRELYITKAKEIELHNKKSIIIYVPMPKLKAFQKIQIRLVRELEKKFSGKHVDTDVSIRRHLGGPRVPAEIVGKRIRIKLDGSQLIKVHLDKNQQTTIEHKVDTFQSVYKKLTGREVTFEFPEPYL